MIPGTPYAAPNPYPTPRAGIGHEQFGDDPSDVSLEERMERLHDFVSTHLYIEGTPAGSRLELVPGSQLERCR